MGGTSKSEQTTQQRSETNPWAPTQGILSNILTGIQGQTGNYQTNANEQGAINTLRTNAANTPNFTPQATSLTNDLLSGGTDRTGILGNAYSQFQGAMSPYLSADYLDPTKSPGIQSLLDTVRGDVSNSINGQFAGAGRDLSGLNTQALARGITQAEAPILLNQYNQNVAAQQGAASDLLNGAGSTAAGLSGLDQQSLQNRLQGLGIGTDILPQVGNVGANNTLAAESLARGLPLQNLGLLENLTVPIAGLGGQSSGTSTTQGSYTMSPLQQALGWANFAKTALPTAGQGIGILSKLFPTGG